MKRSVFSSPSLSLSFFGITMIFELSVRYALHVVIIVSIKCILAIIDKIDMLVGYHGVFWWLRMESTDKLDVGDYACFTWKKTDGSAIGASEGLFLGCFGDEISGEFLVFDRSCYKDSFKTGVFSLGIHDLKIVPANEINSVNRRWLRDRPPNQSEKFSFLVDAFYYSNIDYKATYDFIQNINHSLKLKIIGNSKAEYGINIKAIPSASEASINITCKGKIQITCQQANMDKCINWLENIVKLPENQKRFVLFPKQIAYRVFDSFKEKSVPPETLIEQIGSIEGSAIIVPLGWEQKFLKESDRNALSDILNNDYPNTAQNSSYLRHQEQGSKSGLTVEKYIGNRTPCMRLIGQILKQEDEDGLLRMWEESRSDVSQVFDTGTSNGEQIKAHVLIHDLVIDKKTGRYKVLIRSYYDNQFNNISPKKNITSKLKTNHSNTV